MDLYANIYICEVKLLQAALQTKVTALFSPTARSRLFHSPGPHHGLRVSPRVVPGPPRQRSRPVGSAPDSSCTLCVKLSALPSYACCYCRVQNVSSICKCMLLHGAKTSIPRPVCLPSRCMSRRLLFAAQRRKLLVLAGVQAALRA